MCMINLNYKFLTNHNQYYIQIKYFGTRDTLVSKSEINLMD